jgi:hypothetical protein
MALLLWSSETRLVTFKITGNGNVTVGAVTLECCPQTTPIAPGSVSDGAMVYTPITTITVPANKTTEYFAGSVSGTFHARISTPVTGGTATVLAVRLEEQRGMPRPQAEPPAHKGVADLKRSPMVFIERNLDKYHDPGSNVSLRGDTAYSK